MRLDVTTRDGGLYAAMRLAGGHIDIILELHPITWQSQCYCQRHDQWTDDQMGSQWLRP